MDPIRSATEFSAELRNKEGAHVVTLAENQPEYRPLPVVRFPDGVCVSEWVPDNEERRALMLAIFEGKPVRVRVHQSTFNTPPQPLLVEIV